VPYSSLFNSGFTIKAPQTRELQACMCFFSFFYAPNQACCSFATASFGRAKESTQDFVILVFPASMTFQLPLQQGWVLRE